MYLTRKKKELKRAQAYCDAINKDLDNVAFETTPRANEIRDIIIPQAIIFINKQLRRYSVQVDEQSPIVGSWKYFQCVVELKEKEHGEN